MASIQKRVTKDGKVSYRALVRVKGHPVQSATFSKRSDAIKWSLERESEIRFNRYFTTQDKDHTFGELVDHYLSQALHDKKDKVGKTIKLNWWKKELGDYKLCDISSSMISECRLKLQKENTHYGTPRTTSTVNRYLAALSHAYTVASKEWDWIDHNPVVNVKRYKEPRGRVRFLDDQERKRLLDACKESRSCFLYPILSWRYQQECVRVKYWD